MHRRRQASPFDRIFAILWAAAYGGVILGLIVIAVAMS